MTLRVGLLAQTGATAGQVITWNNTTGKWEPATPSGGSYTDPLTTQGDLVGRSATATTRIPVGTDGWVLTADSTQPNGVKWAASASGFADPTTTKGDLIVHGTSTTRMPVGTDGQVLTADSTQALGVKWGAAAGSAWNQVLNLPLTSLTNWTSADGTWSINATSGQMYVADATNGRIYYNRSVVAPASPQIIEVEVKIDSDTGSYHRAGLSPSGAGSSGSPLGYIYGASPNSNSFSAEQDGVAGVTTIATSNLAYGSWHKLRLKQSAGGGMTVWIDGVLIGTTGNVPWSPTGSFGLFTLGVAAHFRNLKVWQQVDPAL